MFVDKSLCRQCEPGFPVKLAGISFIQMVHCIIYSVHWSSCALYILKFSFVTNSSLMYHLSAKVSQTCEVSSWKSICRSFDGCQINLFFKSTGVLSISEAKKIIVGPCDVR